MKGKLVSCKLHQYSEVGFVYYVSYQDSITRYSIRNNMKSKHNTDRSDYRT